MRTPRICLLAALALVATSVHAELTVEQRLQDFDYFWKTYQDAYVFFQLKKDDHGVDWDAIGARMRARLQGSKSDLELYAAVTEAQAALRDGHCYNEAFSKIRETTPIYFQRIQLALAEGEKVAVTKVVDGTAFAEAGIEVGDELIRFGGRTIRQLAEQQRPRQAASSEGMFWSSFASQLYIHDPMQGPPEGETAELVFRKPSGETVAVTSPWNQAPPTGAPSPMESFGFGATPADGVQLSEAEKLAIQGPLPMDVRVFRDWNIGYVGIETWMKTDDPMEQMDQVMTALKDTDGLVVDVRGNGGGVGTWGVLFANYFVKPGEKSANDSWMERKLSKAFFRAAFQQIDEAQLEELFTSPETMHYVLTKAFGLEITQEEVEAKYFQGGRFQPFYLTLPLNEATGAAPVYEKPVSVLTDGGCYSTTDIFLTILDEFHRVEIVGTPNGAGSGSPIPFKLPHSGLNVYVPHARAYPPMGSMIEGRPRPPTVPAAPSLEDLRTGRDTILNAAVKALYDQLHPAMFGTLEAAPGDFDVGAGERLMEAPEARPFEWGQVPTPDWAIEAKLRHVDMRGFELPGR